MSKTKATAYEEGVNAVRAKPQFSPENPYDEEGELRDAWDNGAYSAGICDIYTNGVLKKSER